jgi:polysaccharide export outer membrane protein
MIRNLLLVVILCVYFVFSGCKTREKLIYIQDSDKIQTSSNNSFDPLLKLDDCLSITVLGIDPDAVKPFNMPISTTAAGGNYSNGSPSPPGYVIDPEGNIDFPAIGKVKVAGLKRSEMIALMKSKLESYVQNPIILVKILNYKITVIGDVKNPGTFTIPNEKITIFEALGIAGDLLVTGKRNNIKVIRDINGERKEYQVDLTSSNVFSSPVYYLQQNDLVYVEPNRSKINSSVVNPTNVGIILSSASVLITLFILITR